MRISISPANRLEVELRVPGDKSISHRALMLGAIADGETRIENLATSQDVASTAACIRALGVEIQTDGASIIVHGRGLAGLSAPTQQLNAGNSGTTMRVLSGILAGHQFNSEITGDSSLRKRPMARIIEPLSEMGARIDAIDDNYAPLSICGSVLQGTTHEMKVKSAQVKSALLLAGLHATGTTKVIEPVQTRDHTERMLQSMAASISIESGSISIQRSSLRGSQIEIPGDISSAAFWIAAAVLVPDSHVVLRGVGVNPTRTGLIEALRSMGADIQVKNMREQNFEPIADIEVEHSELKSIQVNGAQVPLLIDELPLLAVVATQAEGRTMISDASELRVKETDRIAAIAKTLRTMGAEIEVLEDGMIIEGPTRLRGAKLDSFGDHRIAMSGAVAALVAKGDSHIEGAEWVDVSYPKFFETLEAIRVG